MKESLKKLAIRYFNEVAVNPNNKDPEEIETMADNFVADVLRFMDARRDFKEVRND